jgi:hypothetical protein
VKIPRSFQLYGRTIKVETRAIDGEACAQWEASRDMITIDPNYPPDIRQQAFYHEFLHAAFDSLGRDDLSQDEKVVDGLAGMIHQMLKSAK